MLYLHGVLSQHSPSSDFGENQLSRGLISLSLPHSSHPRTFQRSRVRSSTVCYHSFNLLKCRSPPLRVYYQQLYSRYSHSLSLRLRNLHPLSLLLIITRRLIMQKAGGHALFGAPTLCMQMVTDSFHSPSRGSFHLSLAVLVHYR